ncbi:MAG TPA: hypothetical protein VLI06_17205 [Solimonas sp.]|nr:hypothetical protein [Solimonas sp.]
MSIFKRLQELVGGSSASPRRNREEPRLPEHLFVIPERGPVPQPIPVKRDR